jgi:hypothetical protein
MNVQVFKFVKLISFMGRLDPFILMELEFTQ